MARRYPPLLSGVVALAIAVAVLPSSLNVRQVNPSETLEYAPVPADDADVPPPPATGLLSLGMAPGSGGREPPPERPLAAIDEVLTKTPTTKRCVGSPPRQTEDPLSPPCVAFFDGDNGGATYPGVAPGEIRILFYIEGFTIYRLRSGGNERTPDHQLFDLWQPPEDDEHVVVRVLRGWQRYFADRYQTYDRLPHFFVYFSSSDASPEARRGDAIVNYSEVQPLAVLSYARTNNDAYLGEMAKRGVLNFGSFLGRSASFFAEYPGRIWGYFPSLEQQARQYAGFVCTKVVPHPVSFSGNGDHGQPRRLGLVYTTDGGRPELRLYKDEVKRLVESCGGEIVAEATYPSAGWYQDNRYAPGYATEAMVDFRQRGVTTIIWPGGLETNMSRAARQLDYYPEWVVSGDRVIESTQNSQGQDPEVWSHAWVVSNITLEVALQESLCFQAYRESDPSAPVTDAPDACTFYDDLRQLFTGIQVAGPRLTPGTVDRGFHAIPAVASDDPRVPACFYEPADYTCIKDAAAWWWDPGGQSPNHATPGCWRLAQGGRRYIADGWPTGDVLTLKGDASTDPCTGFESGSPVNANPSE